MIDELPWSADPADVIAAAEPDPGWLLRHLAATEEPWMAHAACRHPKHRHIDFFANGAGKTARAALDVCGNCRVLLDCRRWALDPDHPMTAGIAGGMTAAARDVALRRRRRRHNETAP